MKKIILLLAVAFVATSVNAQNLRSKNGERILPQAQDWAVGIDANPFFSYLKGLIGQGNNATAPSSNFLLNNQMITGKYFLESDVALRASLRIGTRASLQENSVIDRTVTGAPTYPNLPLMRQNSMRMKGTTAGLSFGVEKRRGDTRLQGYYGAELGFIISTSRDVFKYGNPLSVSSTNPVGIDVQDEFAGANNITNDTYGNVARITERNNGGYTAIGLRTFVGAEYFIFPKISIGGEFGWGIGYQSSKENSVTLESIDNSLPAVGTQVLTDPVPRKNSFRLDTDNNNSMFGPAGSIRLNLHF